MEYYGAIVIVPNLLAAAFTAGVAYKVLKGKETEHRTAMAICFAFVSLNFMVLTQTWQFIGAVWLLKRLPAFSWASKYSSTGR